MPSQIWVPFIPLAKRPEGEKVKWLTQIGIQEKNQKNGMIEKRFEGNFYRNWNIWEREFFTEQMANTAPMQVVGMVEHQRPTC